MSRFERRVSRAKGPGLEAPDARYHIAETLVVFDNLERVMKVVSHVDVSDLGALDEAYAAAVARIGSVVERLHGQIRMAETRPDVDNALAPVTDRFQLNSSPERYQESSSAASSTSTTATYPGRALAAGRRADPIAPVFDLPRAAEGQAEPYMFYLDFGTTRSRASPELWSLEDGVVRTSDRWYPNARRDS